MTYNRDGGITLMNRQNGTEAVDFEYAYGSGSNRLSYIWDNESFGLDHGTANDRRRTTDAVKRADAWS